MSVALDRVSFAYEPSRPVVHDASMTVPERASLALVGPSGSGKSTLLALIGLLLVPDRGDVRIDGAPVPTRPSVRRRIREQTFGWVFQTVNTLPRRSVFDNVALGLLGVGHRRRDITAEVLDSLGTVGLAGMEGRPVEELSGGELQRACIARAMVRRPPVILADEPTGQLDAANSNRVAEALLVAVERGSSVIVATHDLAVAGHCSLQAHIDAGQVRTTTGLG